MKLSEMITTLVQQGGGRSFYSDVVRDCEPHEYLAELAIDATLMSDGRLFTTTDGAVLDYRKEGDGTWEVSLSLEEGYGE